MSGHKEEKQKQATDAPNEMKRGDKQEYSYSLTDSERGHLCHC